MSNANLPASSRAAIAAVIDPDAYTAGTRNSAWVSMENFETGMALILVGDIGASGTLRAKLEQATSAAGAGVKDISDKVITPFTAAGSDQNKQAIINFHSAEMDADNNFNFVRLTITTVAATCDFAGSVIVMNPRYGPASDKDASSVDEIVT